MKCGLLHTPSLEGVSITLRAWKSRYKKVRVHVLSLSVRSEANRRKSFSSAVSSKGGGFEETVFEIVEVEHGGRLIELPRGEALVEVKFLRPLHLYVCQLADGAL